MKHQHYDVIKAWAKGLTIQFKDDGSKYLNKRFQDWNDILSDSKWGSPDFNDPNKTWRVKPQTKTIKYRLALMSYKSEEYYTAVFNMSTYFLIEFMNSPNFVKWVSDWIEQEVEE